MNETENDMEHPKAETTEVDELDEQALAEVVGGEYYGENPMMP